MKKVSIRFTIISLFLFLLFVVLSIMYFAQYNFIDKLSQKATQTQFDNISANLDEKLKSIDRVQMLNMDIFTKSLKNESINDVFNDKDKYLSIYTTYLDSYKNLYSVYIGTKNDKFFEVINLKINKRLIQKYNVKKEDKWLLIEMNGQKGIQTLSLYDKNLKLTSKKELKTEYRPSKRPWFEYGMSGNGLSQKSEPYMFGSIEKRGITYTKKFNRNMVFAIDILLEDLNKLLQEQSFLVSLDSYLITKDKVVVASSNLSNTNKTRKLLKYLNLTNEEVYSRKLQNKNAEKYIYYIKKVDDDYLVSIANLDQLLKLYTDDFKKAIYVTSIIAIILLPLVWYISSLVIKPMLLLSKENEKILKREYSKIEKIDSNISEVSQLSNSMYNMAKVISNRHIQLEEEVKIRTKELEELSITDKLTGIYNRMKIDNSLAIEADRENRYKRGFGIIIVDIDYFKQVNDTYGHQAGDIVLQEFSKILKQNIRKTDILGRWGGEEFIIICIEIDFINLKNLAQKIRKNIEKFNFSYVGEKTASFGIALYKENEKVEHLISRADTALYKAKKSGRNRVEVG